MEWFAEEKETILIYGNAKTGKTWAYCSFIEQIIAKGGKIFIINTDNGVSKTLKQYFGDKSPTITQAITYYFISDLADIFEVVREIKEKAQPKDLIIIDLISDFWEMAQNKFMEECSGGNIIGFIERMSKDIKTFGMFDSSKWNYIKKLDGYIIESLITRAPCNIIGVSAQKDLDIEKAMNKGKTKSPDYEAAGAKPAGQPTLAYRFNTVVYIGKTERGEKHYFQIMGDRGAVTNQGMISFDKSFWETFEKERIRRYSQ